MTTAVEIVKGLEALVDTGKVKTDEESLQQFGCDWTKVYDPQPLAIVFPKQPNRFRLLFNMRMTISWLWCLPGGVPDYQLPQSRLMVRWLLPLIT